MYVKLFQYHSLASTDKTPVLVDPNSVMSLDTKIREIGDKTLEEYTDIYFAVRGIKHIAGSPESVVSKLGITMLKVSAWGLDATSPRDTWIPVKDIVCIADEDIRSRDGEDKPIFDVDTGKYKTEKGTRIFVRNDYSYHIYGSYVPWKKKILRLRNQAE